MNGRNIEYTYVNKQLKKILVHKLTVIECRLISLQLIIKFKNSFASFIKNMVC